MHDSVGFDLRIAKDRYRPCRRPVSRSRSVFGVEHRRDIFRKSMDDAVGQAVELVRKAALTRQLWIT